MKTETCNYDIVRFKDGNFELEVSVSPWEETVWLDIGQLSLLFGVKVPALVKHIANIIDSEELDNSTISILEKVQIEGNRKVTRKTKIFNLDMIIAVGYRVNSRRGTIFRRWANSVLKQYMLKGYSIDSSRVLVTQENYLNLVNAVNRIDDRQHNLITRVEKLEGKEAETGHKLFFQGQLYDAVSCIERIISGARESIILIDNYADRQTLDLLTKKRSGVSVRLFSTEAGLSITEKELKSFNCQYGNLTVKITNEFHDRFIILDRDELYHCGASVKDAGRKTFGISKIDDDNYLKSLLERVSSIKTEQ